MPTAAGQRSAGGGSIGAPIEISGAGPSGLAAALTASRAGRRVIVYERSSDVGHRFHDDFQGLENWTTDGDVIEEIASLGIEPTFEHTPFREIVVFDAGGRAHRYRSARPMFYLVRRGPVAGSLDASLKGQALACGVEIRFGEVRHHLPGGGIVAEGPHGADAIAVGHVFATAAADGAYGALSDQLAPKGYAYLLVCQGRATIASCMFDDFHQESLHLERAVDFFREKVGFDMENPRRFGGAGSFTVPSTARRGRVLLAGEAAGFQDALWGFGMRFALLSGSLAARSLLGDGQEEYDHLWSTRFGGLLRAGIVNRFLYGKLGGRGYTGLTRWLDRAADPRAWLGLRYRPSLPKTLLYPMARRSVQSIRRKHECALEGCDCTWCRCQHAAAPRMEAESGVAGRASG
jgi:flavin-dependent dehydrogenase